MLQELTLFEFGRYLDTRLNAVQLQDFKTYLESIWVNRNRFWDYPDQDPDEEKVNTSDMRQYRQGFLRFDGSCISPRNYVGFIQFDDLRISIYPKVFNNSDQPSSKDCQRYLEHLLYWLSYCSKVRFPFSQVIYQPQDTDSFLEVLIYLFSHYTAQVLEQSRYQCYEDVTERTDYMRGSLATQLYVQESLLTGNWHQLRCRYEPFQCDNLFNRIIKHTAKFLSTISRNELNKEALRKIYYLLDEVTEQYCTYEDCSKVKLNRLHNEWEPVLAMCRLFLASQTIGQHFEDNSNFCFLLPMEYVFEDFIGGFLSQHFADQFTIATQTKDIYLTDEKVFQLRHDILLTSKNISKQVILDTKYKLRTDPFSDIRKADISQGDMYQMVSYALRRECSEVEFFIPMWSG